MSNGSNQKVCIFKNFRECFYQKSDDVKKYDYLICVACLLSRIEKFIFKNNKSKNGVSKS